MQPCKKRAALLGAVMALAATSGCVTTELGGSQRPTVSYSDAMERCNVENRGNKPDTSPLFGGDSQTDEECLRQYGYDRQWQ